MRTLKKMNTEDLFMLAICITVVVLFAGVVDALAAYNMYGLQ